jgi:GAF domain
MRALRLLKLQQKAIGLVVLFAALTFAEFLVVRFFEGTWDEHERQLEVAQGCQLNAQRLSSELFHFLHGQSDRVGQVVALVNQQDAQLRLLADGGRPDGSDRMLAPVSRLSKITLNHLRENWTEYKKSVLALATQVVWKDSVLSNITESVPDSAQTAAPVIKQRVINAEVEQARTLLDGQWITFSERFHSLLSDLRQDKQQGESRFLWVLAGCAVINVLLITGAFFLFRNRVIIPLGKIEQAAVSRQVVVAPAANEVGQVAIGLNLILEQLNHASTFVQSIGDGNLEVVYPQNDHEGVAKDSLASSLTLMQSKLKAMNEEEQKRKWANEGLTKFVEILRTNDDNLHLLGDRIVSTLVQYTRSSQGGLYVLNDENNADRYLELISLYAFTVKKFEKQKLKLGEGLVGQAFLEKETIYLKEIPEDYIRITSGLGEANPKVILVVPLKVDTEVYGLVELASFQEYHSHEIDFVQRLGETLASTLASVKTNQRTKKLLEDSRLATEAMRTQEQEMRQNVEELAATQEEMGRKEREYILKIKELEERPAVVKQGDDWAVVAHVERDLKVHLEALKIAQEALSKK